MISAMLNPGASAEKDEDMTASLSELNKGVCGWEPQDDMTLHLLHFRVLTLLDPH